MKKRLISLLLCLLLCLGLAPTAALAAENRYLEIDEGTFPDAHFRQYVVGELAGGRDYMTKAEVQNVIGVDLAAYQDIESLTGIEHFTALEKLSCTGNKLAELDVSHNTALKELWCYSNELTELDVSHNTALRRLVCYSNDLIELDVSHNEQLEELYCEYNLLTELDVSQNRSLVSLFCDWNLLTELDVSNNGSLENLACSENRLTKLDVSHNGSLQELWCFNNRLACLDLSENTGFDIYSNDFNGQLVYPQDVIPVAGGWSCDLSARVTDPARVTVTTAGTAYDPANGVVTLAEKMGSFEYQYDTGRGEMAVHVSLRYPAVGDRYLELCEGNFPDDAFRQYVIDELAGGKDYMMEEEVMNVAAIDVHNRGISNMTGVEHFSALMHLNCRGNPLRTLDLSQLPELMSLNCGSDQLGTLDLSHMSALKELDCEGNYLRALDLSQNTALTMLCCSDNRLTALDLSQNTALIKLDCYGNRLTALDLSQNTALTYLDCFDNRLTALDLSQNEMLESLCCYGNCLAGLDLSRNTMLDRDNCSWDDQRLPPLKAVQASAGWMCDLSTLVPDPTRVTVTTEGVSYRPDTGVVIFSRSLTGFDYQYDTGRGVMDMHVSLRTA